MARDPKFPPVREVSKEDLKSLCQKDLSTGTIELVLTLLTSARESLFVPSYLFLMFPVTVCTCVVSKLKVN